MGKEESGESSTTKGGVLREIDTDLRRERGVLGFSRGPRETRTEVSLDVAGKVERMVVGMRKRAKTAGTPSTATPTPATEAAAPAKTKYEALVEVLVDGLFEIMMTEPPHSPDRTKRRHGRGGRGGMP